MKDGVISLWAFNVASVSEAPHVTHRVSPLELGPPSFVRHEVVIEGIDVVLPKPATISGTAVSFSLISEARAGGGAVTYEVKTLKDSVVPAELSGHLEAISSIRESLGEDARVAVAETPKPPLDSRVALWLGLGTLGFFFVSIVIVSGALLAFLLGRRLRWRRVGP